MEPESPQPARTGPAESEAALLARAKQIFVELKPLDLVQREEALMRLCGGAGGEGSSEGPASPLRSLVMMLLEGSDSPLPYESLAEDIRAASERVVSATTASPSRSTGETGRRTGTPADDFDASRQGDSQGGSRLGNYRLLERLGEGGFGVVFMAEQERPIRRRVALKIIKLGMDTKQVVARFEAERQALALMDHPNIAKVFDAGATETGRPYFVMELVRGSPITEYCDRKKLAIRQRLELMSQVCDALQHAHQKGVIHRDIKPSNVLVQGFTESRDQGNEKGIEKEKKSPSLDHSTPQSTASLDPFRVKIIDFGIAKATSARLTEKTIFTEFRQMIGTPEYMSPEQAGESNEDVDTRTDVYSAGVLLYELLTGSTPFDSRRLRSAAFGEMQRIIREEDPPKPSTKIRSRAETLDAIAAARAVSPAKLPGAVRGELDWIVMKAMEKDRSRRYDSAGSMARDLQRYLRGEAVQAAPPSKVYIARKFVRRHRGSVLAASLLAIALVAGLIGTSVGFLNAEAQRRVAEGETARAEAEKERADEHAANAIAQKQAAEWQTYRANMSAAITSLEAGQPARVRVRLDACPPSLRGWEWTYVRDRLDMSKRRFSALDYPGMGDLDADFSPDGTTFVTPFQDPVTQRFGARIADARTGQTRRTLLGGHTNHVYFTMFNRDGTKVLTGSSDGSARVYDAANGQEIVVLHTGAAEVRRVTFDLTDEHRDRSDTLSEPAGWIITVTGDGWIHVFDETTYKLIARQQFGAVYTAFRIPGTRSIVFTRGFDPPMIWHVDADDAASVNVEPLLPEYPLCNWAIPSLDGTRVAACYSNQVVRVIDLSSRRMLTNIRGHLAQMGGMAFSPDGSRLVTASLDSTVRVWDPSSGEQLRVLFGHEGYIWSADFNADGSEILTAGNGAVLAWNTRAIDDRESLSTHGIQGYDCIAYSPDGSLLVTSSLQNGVRLHDARTHQLLREIDAAPSTHIAFSTDGKRLASVCTILAGAKGPADSVHLWDVSTWESLAVINPPPSGVNAVALNTDGSRIAVSTWNHGGHLYDGEGNLIASMPGFGHWAGGMTFTPDGSVLLAGLRGDRLFQWRAADGARLADSPIAVSGLNSLVCNSSGSCVLGATEAGYAVLWDAASGKVIHELRGHGGPLRGAAFFAGGSRIVTAGRDGTVRLWDSASGEEVAMFRTVRSFPEVLAVNPNGEEIAVIFDDIDAQFFGIARDRNQGAASGSASTREP